MTEKGLDSVSRALFAVVCVMLFADTGRCCIEGRGGVFSEGEGWRCSSAAGEGEVSVCMEEDAGEGFEIKKFKLYNSRVTRTLTYKSFQFKLLNIEIREKQRLLKLQEDDYHVAKADLRKVLSWLDYQCLSNRLLESNKSRVNNIKNTHERKLTSLGISPSSNINRDKVVVNLSQRNLTETEKEVLSFGLSFGLPKLKINYIQHYFGFEKLLASLKKLKGGNFNDIVQGITTVAHDSFKDFPKHKYSLPSLPKTLFQALKTLKADKSIIITKPDKGRGTVILDKVEYVNKVEEILNDKTKFKSILEDPFKYITKLEDKLARILRKLLKLKVITDETFKYLYSSGSTLGVLYGLPKIHKVNNPIRPILSTIGTFNYNLAKFFVPIIEPLTVNNFTLQNSYDFVKEIRNINMSNKIMASFDVQSLFTNIPLNETIEIITKGLYKDSPKYMDLTKTQFKELLGIAVKESPFLFNDKLYMQTDGVAMGSCLGPSFANAFLCHHETRWISDCPDSFKPVFYKRYVDDTFLLFSDLQHVTQFLNYLNSKHDNIKFTCDLEKNNTLPFLDVLVTRNSDRVVTSVYRKPTFTGLGTHFFYLLHRDYLKLMP